MKGCHWERVRGEKVAADQGKCVYLGWKAAAIFVELATFLRKYCHMGLKS